MGKPRRVYQLDEETSLGSTDYVMIDRDGNIEPKKATVSDLVSGGCLITDVAIIATITDEANWVNQMYVGSTVGLTSCNYYFDMSTRIKYEYNGTYLIRYSINNIL